MKPIDALYEIKHCLGRLCQPMPSFFCDSNCESEATCSVYYWRPECAQKHIAMLNDIFDCLNGAVVVVAKHSGLPQDDRTKLVSSAQQLGESYKTISDYIRHYGTLSREQCDKERDAYECAHVTLYCGTAKLKNELERIITDCMARLVVAGVHGDIVLHWKIPETKNMIIGEIKKEMGHVKILAEAVDNVLERFPELEYPSIRAIRAEYTRRTKRKKR